MKRWFLVGIALGIVFNVVVCVLSFLLWQRTDLIAFGVCVQGVHIGGTKVADARHILESVFAHPVSVALAVVHQGRVIRKVQLRELGIKPEIDRAVEDALRIGRRESLKASLVEFLTAWKDGVHLPMPYYLDQQTARKLLSRLARSLNRPPRQALIEWNKGKLRIVPSRKGVQVEVEGTLKKWDEELKQGRWETLPLVMNEYQPEVTAEDLAAIDGIVGNATTVFRTSENNRAHNIRLAASRLDHTLIRPNEEISFNSLVGPRTHRQGFRIARILMQGQFTEDFGGGVCQVAGTLYLAALRAGMEVIERHKHSRSIAYLLPGLDAAVNFGSLDLKLRNPFDTPLYLRAFVKGGCLTVLVLGKRQQGTAYKIVRTAREAVDKGGNGYRVTVWRLQVENGIAVKRERISDDIYRPWP